MSATSSSLLIDCRSLPRFAAGVLVAPERFGLHLDAVAGRFGHGVVAAAYDHRVDEVLVQVVYELDAPAFRRAAHRDVIEDREVLHILAEADAARVRADGHAELLGHEQHGQHLVDAAEAATVDLAEADGPGLQELLEHDAVVAVLARGHA